MMKTTYASASKWFGGLALALLLPLGAAHAAGAAVVKNLSGVVSAQKADGTVRALSKGSEVAEGETVFTGKGSYANFKFTDGGDLTLQPDTSVKIDKYGFDKDKPEDDGFSFSLVKGGLRSITGLIGKRGNRDAYKLNTETATIGIRGTDYSAAMCRNCGKVPNGLYLSVISGIINATNSGGSMDISAGNFAHIANATTPPVILPAKPEVQNLDSGDKNSGGGDNDGGTGGAGCYVN